MKGKNSFLYIVIAIVVVIGGIVWYTSQKGTMAPTKEDAPKMIEKSASKSARIINVKGSPFKFEPSEIRVKYGERIRIVFVSEKGMHDWVVDEFEARTNQIKDGETDSVEFTPNKEGTFEFYCSVGNHRAMGMKGNLIVE